jgi:septal ring factor EnvC (AmiA/AmiB activator)
VSRTRTTTSRKVERARLLAAALTLAATSGLASLETRAQSPGPAAAPATADDAAKTLERQRSELEAQEARDRELQKDLTNLRVDSREINARLVETAALVQRSEEQMTAIEDRLAAFERQERDIRASLAKEHGKMSNILAALQRMGRNPPPVIITRREDALEMVRSAMLLGIAFPGLKEEAAALTKRLNELVTVMASIRREGENLRAERDRLTATQARLASLLETKKQSLAERQAELRQVRLATAEISKKVTDLSELIAKLSQQVATPPPPAASEPAATEPSDQASDQATVAMLPPADASGPPAEDAPPIPAARTLSRDTAVEASPGLAPQKSGEEVGMLSPPTSRTTPPSIVEMAPQPSALMPGKHDRITPAIPFQLAKGKLSLPARGRRALAFGEKTKYGGTSKGIVIETRFGARVTSPCDGWVVYAGEFRSYGQLLIINAGGGYHVLVAGLSQMDVGPGQFVLASEPIGTMSGAPRTAQLASDRPGMAQTAPQTSAPVLYVEFRKDGQPIDSAPWWAASNQKVQD